ncbi:MAG: JAB domain-containing protein [Syntrophales bacterium]
MDMNTFARSPMSLSKPFFDDITKDIPSPVSKDFYDAVSKPATEPTAPAAPARYEMASPGEITETVGAIGEAVFRTPLQVAGAAASAIRGGSREAVADKDSFMTRIIDRANTDAEEFQKKYAENKVVLAPLSKLGLPDDITTETITRFPQQAAFSAVSAGAGLAAGVPAGAAATATTGPVGGIVAGRAAGMAASGGVAYRMQKDNSTKDLYEKLNTTSIKATGRKMSPDEWKTAYDKNEGSLIEQGISEAIPEAIGNLVGFELFFGAAKNVFGKQLAKTTIGKTLDKHGAGAAGKMLAEQATEQATETWTQQWQHNIDVEMGLTPGATKRSWTSFDDLRQSNKEVFADILLLSTIMGGAAIAGEHVKDKMDTKKSAQLVKDVVAENKFDSIPNEFLPAIYEHAQELSEKRASDKDLATARDAFATEMDKRGIDFDMTSKFKEYLKLDAAIKADDATGEDVARWVSLRDEFKEKNISPDLYQGYLQYQADINKASALTKLLAEGKATEPQRKEFNRLVDAIASKGTMLGLPEEALESAGVGKGGVIGKPLEPAKSGARDILLGDESAAKRKNLTATDILTEGDVNIQSEKDLTPENVAAIDKKLEIAGTGGARKPLDVPGGVAGKTLDITTDVKAKDKEKFDLWDTQETGTPAFVRAKVERLFAEGGEAAVLDEYKSEDTVAAYARYRLGMLARKEPQTPAKAEQPGKKQSRTLYRGSGRASEGAAYNDLTDQKSLLGGGQFWAFSEKDALTYGPNVEVKPMPEFSNPLTIKNDVEWKTIIIKALGKYDSKDVSGIDGRVSYPLPTGMSPEKMELWRKGVSDYLKENGHDALIIDMDGAKYDEAKTLGDVFGHSQVFIPQGTKVPAEIKAAGTGGARGQLEAAKPASGKEVPVEIGQEQDLVKKIASGGVDDFTFPEHYSPMDLKGLWDDLYTTSEDIAARNKPTIGALAKERDALKSNRSKEAVARKKQIDEEIEDLRVESRLVIHHAEVAWQNAQDDLANKVVAKLKEEGIEADPNTVYDAISTLADGRMNEQGWQQPLLRQVIDSVKEAKEPEITSAKGTPEPTPESYEERMKKAGTADEGRKLISQYEEEFASIERESGLAHSVGTGGSGFDGRGYSTLTPKEKKTIARNVTAKNSELGNKLQSLIKDIEAADPHWKALLEKEHKGRGSYSEEPAKAAESNDIKAAGIGGRRNPAAGTKPEARTVGTNVRGEITKYNENLDDHQYDLPPDIEIVRSGDREKEIRRQYGPPNASGGFSKGASSVYVDDDTGKPVAFVPSRKALLDDGTPFQEREITPEEIEADRKFREKNIQTPQEWAENLAKANDKANETDDIKAAGTGGARAPKAKKESTSTTAPEPKKEEKPALSSAEVKTKEEEAKSKVVKKYLLEHIDEALAARTAYENNKTEEPGPMHVIIEVPTDGKFVIVNDVKHLEKFKKNVAKLKVTAALNNLPQHSDKRTGKSTDLITKEAEAEAADYWTKRNEWKARYEGIPAEIEAAKARFAKYEEIRRKVDAKEITLKQLGEDAKTASDAENAGHEAWRDSWFGRTPTYNDLMGRIREIEKEIRVQEEAIPSLKARINEYYPGLAKEMFEGKTAEVIEAPTEIKAVGTGGKRGPTTENEAKPAKDEPKKPKSQLGETQDEISTRLRDQNRIEAELASRAIRERLFAAPASEKEAIVEQMSKEQAEEAIKQLDAAPGDDRYGRSAIYKKYPDLKPADIQKEIAEISDDELDALLDTPETEARDNAAPPKTIDEAKRDIFARARAAGKFPPAKPAKALDDILSAVAKEGVEGAGEALKGLYELFGGSSLKSFPGGFDPDTYAKAKPHFEAALEHFIQVGKGLREFAATIVKQFGDAIRPYLKQFIQEKRDGVTEVKAEEEGEAPINLDENTGTGEGGARTRRKLTEQEKAEKKVKEAAAEEKKARKAAMGEFKNVGYVYDPEKLNQKIKDKPPKSAAKIILDEMLPGKLWAIDFPEDSSPGTVRLKTQMQQYFLTFKEYLVDNGDRLRYMSGKTIDGKIDYWLNYRNGSIDMLKTWAAEYGKTLQPIIDAFNGQTSITNIIGKLQDTVLPGERFGAEGSVEGAFPPHYSKINSVEATEKFASFEKLLGRLRQSFYSFLTDSWHYLLADENDILLSEIDIHKRGRNKTVVRSGLPDYRADIQLKKTEDFQVPFGFKGVGFGEEGWINQEERNRVIPAAFDAFKDLAATIGAPDNGMSLGGELAVQFANLGHKAKGAAAAYFPGVRTINFTRDNGDGTMSHEWGHGLHDLADGGAIQEINSIIKTFYNIYDFDAGTRLMDDLLAKDSMFLKRMVSSKKQHRIQAVKDEVTKRFEDTVRVETDYYKTAKQLDADYTARAQEMWARAFESYIYDTLAGRNNYLVTDFVAAGRVGGKAGTTAKLVYPAGKERETFNATIKHFIDGLEWDESGRPSLKEDYVTIEKAHELMLQLQLKFLLDQVQARYKAIWTSEPSKDGFFWYRYDATSFGPMMQPDGYDGYDKAFTSEGQNGTGAVAYLTQLHPDAILDYKLTNIQYEGENPTYISKKRGGIDASLSEDGTEALEEVPAGTDRGTDKGGDVREGDSGSGRSGLPGTRGPGKQRGADGSSEGDSAEGIHPSPAGNYRITDPTLNDSRSVGVRFAENLAAIKILKLIESENRLPSSGTVSFGTEAPPGGWTEADKVPDNQRTIKSSIDEKGILARYSGWGGMSELFAYEPTAAWAGKAELLKAELSYEEIESAASSSTSAYYTPVPVGTFMWKLAQRLGFEKGVVLDPATGANGLFLGTMPSDLALGVTLQGIEMDDVSARIASKLYGLAMIEKSPFQDVKKPNNRFDLTITNVPFENITPTDLKHNKGGHKLHNYFINKMLNLTAPGALSMMITTSNTLDAVGAHLTEFAEKAHFVGAIRLPSGIYSATNVSTDILVFRKKIEGGKFKGVPVDEWTTTGKDESTGLTINNYFLNHPEMVAGKLEKITGRYGNDQLRTVGEGDLRSNLERIAAAFPDKIVEREAVKEAKSIDDIIAAPGTIKEGGAYINDKGDVCEKIEGEEIKLPVATASEQKKTEIVRGYVLLLDHVRTTLRAQKTETDDEIVKGTQRGLKKAYDRFVKAHGPVSDPKNAAIYNDYTDSAWVLALEECDPDTGKVIKIADIFTKNITGAASRPDRADTDHDALALALDEFGYPNLEYMARLRNSDVESMMKGVADKVIENPETGFLETMEEYLSGNIKRKLAVARDMAASNPEYARNVALLEAAQPAEIPSHRITARAGASWISPEHMTDFVRDKMGLDNKLSAAFNFNPISNEWTMTFKGESGWKGENKAETQRQIERAKQSIEATVTWGTTRMDFFKLMECAIQGKRPQVTYTVDRKQYLDEVATQAAENKLQDIQAEFARWLFADAERADQAVKRFNDIINTSVPMKADGSHLTFPGKSMWMATPKEKELLGIGNDALAFYPHQVNAVWKYLKNGNIYLAHEVGAGKTVTMALIAMEAKRLRGKKKVLYVTLNDSTMGQAVQEIKNLYPLANIMPVRVSTQEQRKQRALQKIALNDFDIAIMRQQDLDRISLSPESERVFIDEELQELREILEEAKSSGARLLEQDIQVQIHALEERLKAPSVHDEAKKQNLFFDDLGIDLMIVDESHGYKNVPYATRLTRITGLNPAGSPTAKAFFRKTQYMNAQYPKRDGIVLASGTALSNSIAEMYNIQRMLQSQEVKRQGVWSFDRWIANHGDMGSQLEWDGARGEYKSITTNRRIVNAGRLLATAYQNVDSVRAKDTPIKRPVIRGGEPQRVKVAPNQYVEDYKRIILERCAAIEMDPRHAEFEGVPDNMLRIISNMSKVAIDQRLDHHYANTEMQQDSKIAVASQTIFRRWQEEAKHKGVQLVFADMGVPKRYDKFKYKTDEQVAALSEQDLAAYNADKFEHENAAANFNSYDGLKEELVKLGVPREQIAFIHDADHANKEKKASNLRSLFKKINAGDIRVLIGSTSKAGTGVNIQGRVSDIHHLDIWWNYSAWEQRNGRGIRAGNIYANEGMPGTYIWNYVTETTVDATRWDKVFAKGKVLNAVLGGDINLDVIEDISEATMSAKMMAAEASGDPLMATQATLLQQVQGLRFEQAAHLDVVRRARMDLASLPGQIEALEKCIADYTRSRDIMGKVTAVKFIGDERTLMLEKHGKEIAEALEKAVMADTSSWTMTQRAPLLVFGGHTETEVVEMVEGKDGEKKEKKVKKYAFSPFPAKADITGEKSDPYGRRLRVSGDILSSDRKLADIKIDKEKRATVEVKANVSRTVTEFLSWLNNSERNAKDSIATHHGNEPKLKAIVGSPWAKTDELATRDRELREVEAQMAARGVVAGDPTTGIAIGKYKSVVPMLEDVADKDEWSDYNGIIYPHLNPVMGFRLGSKNLSSYVKSGKLKPRVANQYNLPESLSALNGGKPITAATRPVAYTTVNDVTKFWVPAGASYVTVDPVAWGLLERIIGKGGTWHYDGQGMEDRFIVHVTAAGERNAFILANMESFIPQGAREIGDKAPEPTSYSAAQDKTPAPTLTDVQNVFKGQEVIQPGGESSPIYVKTRGGKYLTIEKVTAISPDESNFEYAHGEKFDPKTMTITGAYGDGNMRLVRDKAGKWTLSHESVHFLEDAGIINAEDITILRDHIRRLVEQGKRKTANAKDIGGAEDRANFLADALTQGKPIGGLAGVVIARIRKFLDRLMEAFGVRTAGLVTRDVTSGRIFDREGEGSPFAEEAYALAPAAIKAYDEALYAHKYVSPRVKPSLSPQEKTVRENAYGVKGMDPVVLDSVAKEMAALIPREARKSAVLVPIPGHTGDTKANVALAERIAAITGSRVADVLKRQTGKSQRDARVAGQRTMKPAEFAMISTETLDGDNVFFVDNVISSGATIRAARDAVGGGKGLVYAKSYPKGEKYAVGPTDLELPRWLGDKVKQAFRKDEVVSILTDAGPIQSGPLDGGCRVLARALKRIEPTGKIITIEGQLEDGTWQAEHYGLELEGGMIDGNGYAASREEWAKDFAMNESLDIPYRITEGEVQSEDIPQDAPTEKKLAAALEKEFAPGEAYGEPRTENENGVYEHLPFFAVTEKGLTRRPRRASNNNQDVANGQEVSETAMVWADNAASPVQGTDDQRKIPAPGGRVLPYVPERGTLPTVKSEPIGTWESSRREITSVQDAAVIARDNLYRDAQEAFVTIVTDKSGKILAVNQHATGSPNQSQVFAYFAAGQILNIEGASKLWIVHNHPSGQPKLSGADLNVSSNISDLIADAGIETMAMIAITPTRYSDNRWSSEEIPPKEPAIYKLPLLGRKFDRSPEGLESIGSQNDFEEFGAKYMKEGGMVLLSAQRQPVATIVVDDYSKLRPLHTEILREAEKRNAVDFMIYSPDRALTQADIDNLLSFARNTQLEFTTVRDRNGDHYEKIRELSEKVRNSREKKVFYSVAKKETDTIDSSSIFPEVNERLKAAKGVKYASLKDRAKDALVTGWEHFTRHFQHLEPETDGAVIDVFRKFQDVPAWAKDETVRRLSGFVGKLSPRGRDVFTMNILLPDMIRDIEDGTLSVEDEDGLPFGYKNRDQVQKDYAHFKVIAEGNAEIMEALDKRNAFMASLTDQLIEHKLLKKEVANAPAAYFHHQVLAYMNYKENPNWGMSSQDVRTHRKGWQVGRKGSQLDYNTEYVESEFEIISQALTQIETVKSLKEIERLADIKPRLEAEAKDQNMETFYRKIADREFVGASQYGDDPLLPFRAKIATGFQKLAKLFTTESDMGSLPMEFDDVIEHIVDQEEQRRAAKEDDIEFDPVPHPRMFALLNYLINHEGPGSMPAAMIFKAIAARNAFIKQVVGKDWVTSRDLIPEGYVAHKPETGSTFYFTNSIADQALSQVMAGHKNLPDAVRQVLARGRDEEWVVKEGISRTLNEFRPAMSDSLPAKMSKNMLTTWKQWILMNPFRVIKYNINNMSGDLDIAMAYDPKIITGYFTQAFKDLWAVGQGKASEKLMDELSELTKRGVVGSGMTAMDIPELGDVKSVKGLIDFFDGKSKGALSKWWTMSKKLSTLRENILRLASNRYFMDRLGRGEIVYGASRKEEVDAIEDHEDKAAKLARELIGDYGNISHAGQYIRERMIPFYSWLEINAPRYVRLFRNLKDEGGSGIGALGGVLAWKATKLAVKASALMGLVMLWNAAFFPDEEDDLQETGRESLHMILGRRADGSIITIRFQGALTDALSWFGMGNPVEQAKKVVSGTKGVGDLAKDVVRAAPLRLFQGFRPEPKLLYETLSGQGFFPDPMHPRPIRDTTEHILRTFSLDRIYNQASGKPKQGGTWASQMYRDIQSLALTESDPGEQAYYTSRKYIFDWLDKQGKEKPVAMPTNKSNSLYYYKQALKFGDFDAAERYLKKYQDMGGRLHDVQGSIKRVHPLSSLKLADRYKFKASLSPEQQETLAVANAWYKKHYVDAYQDQRKRGM